jgi:5-methylcytosine-specific restriction enzyme A
LNLAEGLAELATRYVFERAKSFSKSPFGRFVRHDLAEAARKAMPFGYEDFTLKSSVGAGNWASVPWLAFFDPLITSSAQEGIYVVFLINPDSQKIYLSLNQGTTAVYQEFGRTRGVEVLKRRAQDIRERVRDISKEFSEDVIDLGSEDDLPRGYMAGHCVGKSYTPDEITRVNLTEELVSTFALYQRLINRGGSVPSDMMLEEAETNDIIEARRYLLSRRIERSPKVREAVLSVKPPICQGCGLDPGLDYSFRGRPIRIPLDVHHIAALHNLAEGETRRYKVPKDFLVLCPTCHRVIHSLDDLGDLDRLRELIKFKHMREL